MKIVPPIIVQDLSNPYPQVIYCSNIALANKIAKTFKVGQVIDTSKGMVDVFYKDAKAEYIDTVMEYEDYEEFKKDFG